MSGDLIAFSWMKYLTITMKYAVVIKEGRMLHMFYSNFGLRMSRISLLLTTFSITTVTTIILIMTFPTCTSSQWEWTFPTCTSSRWEWPSQSCSNSHQTLAICLVPKNVIRLQHFFCHIIFLQNTTRIITGRYSIYWCYYSLNNICDQFWFIISRPYTD